MSVKIGSLSLANPVLVASGTFGYGPEFERSVDMNALGALVTKTLTRRPREGNPPPRVVETDSGMLNAVGLQNMGIEAFVQEKLPALNAYSTPKIISILGETPVEVDEMARMLDAADGADAIELNLSCPNVRHQGAGGTSGAALIAQDSGMTAEFVAAARAATAKPLIAKLSPDVTDIAVIAKAAEHSGADALTIANTYRGMCIDPLRQQSRLGSVTGGLSGPAIRPLSVYRVWYTAQHVSVPIVGLGGIVKLEHALEFFLAGAQAVALGTANFANPKAPLKLLKGLKRYMAKNGWASLAELRKALTV